MAVTSIIIPTYNGLELLRDCIALIKQNTEQPYEIIVVDNGSTDRTVAFLRGEQAVMVSLPCNLGFPAACNIGLKVASGDLLVLLNNDVLVGRGWLTYMQECLAREPGCGIVGPMTNFASGRQQIDRPYTTLNREAEWQAGNYRGKAVEVRRIVGLCMLFGRELMDHIGLLDERFSPGHYEDDDYCHRARLSGYRSMIAQDAFVFHHGSESFRKMADAQQELIRRNHAMFVEKWGFDPVQADKEQVPGTTEGAISQ